MNGHRQTGPTGPFRANTGSGHPYSITSSARPSNVAGISMPGALAAPTRLVAFALPADAAAQSDGRPRLRPLTGRPAPPLFPARHSAES
jgi:hypothetical protein